ncbi:hypothetical protein, partial [Microbacterium oxydans]|uniref:hypothetical protein n=1 Tax=Microbacterium oxydans TaxID=82380 RepID=UPI0024AE7AEC
VQVFAVVEGHPAEADVEAEPLEHAKASAQSADLQVAVHGRISEVRFPSACFRLSRDHVGALLLERVGDPPEMLAVVGDQLRSGFRAQIIRESE